MSGNLHAGNRQFQYAVIVIIIVVTLPSPGCFETHFILCVCISSSVHPLLSSSLLPSPLSSLLDASYCLCLEVPCTEEG